MAAVASSSAQSLLRVDPESGIPLATQVRQQLAWLIVSGRLRAGEELPAVRDLAATLGINFHTVRAAYQALDADGLIRTRRGRLAVVLAYDRERWSNRSPDLPTYTLGILVPNYSPYYTPFLQGIQDATDRDPWLLFVCETSYYCRYVARTVDQLIAKGVDGIVFIHIETPHVAEIREILGRFGRLPPIVYADSVGMDGPSILFDREGGGFRATEHLLRHGHRRIAMITPSLDWASMREVHAGYRRALAAADGQSQAEMVETVEGFTLDAGARAAGLLLDRPNPPTAILATGDILAIGAIQAARTRGLTVGRDLAIVGFGEIDFASVVEPPLTTVSMPAHRMGVQAMTLLRQLIGGDSPPSPIRLDVKLVVRQSCGAHS
jgi:DNA-binding LacI/PurR family transcriptional regulator/DNA-binding transcriptional regulator YhcF (GntR family)